MIKFNCPSCNQKLGVPDNYAGKRIRCNKCSQPGIVPQPQATLAPATTNPQPATATAQPATSQIELEKPFNFQSAALPPPDPNAELLRQLAKTRAQREEQDASFKPRRSPNLPDENAPKPHWYWPFLFPIKGAALGMIGIFLLCEIAITYLAILPGVGLAAGLLAVIVRAYIYWYLYLCVQTSATGDTKSPDILQEDEGGVRDMINRMLRMGAVVFVCSAPAVIYLGWKIVKLGQDDVSWNTQIDSIFWSILAAGLYIFPMAMLSVVMNDSLGGLNPILIGWSIVKLPVKYTILVCCFSIPLGLSMVTNAFSNQLGIWFALPAQAISYYFVFVGAAMLGRFFYLNESRLNWEV